MAKEGEFFQSTFFIDVDLAEFLYDISFMSPTNFLLSKVRVEAIIHISPKLRSFKMPILEMEMMYK